MVLQICEPEDEIAGCVRVGRDRAWDHLAMARTYWDAAQRLCGDGKLEGDAPFYLLACHAIELALKATLVRSGVVEQDLMVIGHNLDVCLRYAVRRGFPPLSQRGEKAFAKLSEAHRAQAFRYPQQIEWSRPSVEEVSGLARRILRDAAR
jgi:hypothetical protein